MSAPIPSPQALLDLLVAWWRNTDAGEDWIEPGLEDACGPDDVEGCDRDRLEGDVEDQRGRVIYPVRDLEEQARLAKYDDGRYKRTAYKPVDLKGRVVVIGLHQTGAERPESSKRWHLITAHRAIGPTGVRYRLHPLRTRLVAINRFDRAPYHAVSIEVGGNFEGTDGTGDWYMPAKLGRGRAGEAQLSACVQECHAIMGEVAALGGKVVAVVPHRISGRDRRGKPNRPLCPGSRVWSEAGERFASQAQILTPADGFALGGTPIPNGWHGRFYRAQLARWRG